MVITTFGKLIRDNKSHLILSNVADYGGILKVSRTIADLAGK